MGGRVQDKHAVIVGGGSGIGRATAFALGREGARVGVADLSLDAASAVVDELKGEGIEATPIEANLADESSVNACFATSRDAYGPVDVVFTPGGHVDPALVQKTSIENFDQMIAVHTRGTFLCLKAVVDEWIERKSGKFIAVTSPAATEGQFGGLSYAVAKAGVIGLVKSAALELARFNINVNAILPVAATPMTEATRQDPKVSEKFLQNIPMRRWAEADEVAPGVVYLASNEADYTTGIILPIDGGRTRY